MSNEEATKKMSDEDREYFSKLNHPFDKNNWTLFFPALCKGKVIKTQSSSCHISYNIIVKYVIKHATVISCFLNSKN